MGFFDKVDSVKQRLEQQNANLKEKFENSNLKEKLEQQNANLKEKLDQWNKEPTEEEKAAKELEEKQRELEEKRKELEKKQKEFEEEKEAAEKKEAVNGVALRAAFGEPVFYIDGRSSNLWVYPDKVIMDRAKGGLFNLFNHNVKIIPMKNILTVQFKNSGLFVGSIELGVAGSDANVKDVADTDNENFFMFGSTESGKLAFDAFFYIADKITK